MGLHSARGQTAARAALDDARSRSTLALVFVLLTGAKVLDSRVYWQLQSRFLLESPPAVAITLFPFLRADFLSSFCLCTHSAEDPAAARRALART